MPTHILTSGKIPSDWRLANVIPVFKKGISSNVANYHPISLTSTFSKIFERIVKQQMLAYLFSSSPNDPVKEALLSRVNLYTCSYRHI